MWGTTPALCTREEVKTTNQANPDRPNKSTNAFASRPRIDWSDQIRRFERPKIPTRKCSALRMVSAWSRVCSHLDQRLRRLTQRSCLYPRSPRNGTSQRNRLKRKRIRTKVKWHQPKTHHSANSTRASTCRASKSPFNKRTASRNCKKIAWEISRSRQWSTAFQYHRGKIIWCRKT